jgi:hypothetical protein
MGRGHRKGIKQHRFVTGGEPPAFLICKHCGLEHTIGELLGKDKKYSYWFRYPGQKWKRRPPIPPCIDKKPRKKVHLVTQILGGTFKTKCGMYLSDKGRGVSDPNMITCELCSRYLGSVVDPPSIISPTSAAIRLLVSYVEGNLLEVELISGLAECSVELPAGSIKTKVEELRKAIVEGRTIRLGGMSGE